MAQIVYTPEFKELIENFCNDGTLEVRIRLMDEMEGFVLGSEDFGDVEGRDLALALRRTRDDLKQIRRIVNTKYDGEGVE